MRGSVHRVREEVTARLLKGERPADLARSYGLSSSTIRNWRQALGKEKLDEVRALKKENDWALLAHYLRRNLEGLTAQAVLFADRDWLMQQDARSLALIHRQLFDRAIRLLQRMDFL